MSKRGASSGSAIGRKQIGNGVPDTVSYERYIKAKDIMGVAADRALRDAKRNRESYEHGGHNSKYRGSPAHIDAVKAFNKIVKQYTASWKGK